MNLSFKEKTIWTSLIITILVFSIYFIKVFSLLNEQNIDKTAIITLFIGVVVLMIIIEIVSHIILAIVYKKDVNIEIDEREKLIDLKSTQISYYILIFGVFQSGISLMTTASPFIIANIILFFFILAEIVGDSIRLYYFKRGV